MFDWRERARELLPELYEAYAEAQSTEDLGQFLLDVSFLINNRPEPSHNAFLFAWSLWQEGDLDETTMAATHVLEHLLDSPESTSAAAGWMTETQIGELSHFFVYQHGADGYRERLDAFREEQGRLKESSRKRRWTDP